MKEFLSVRGKKLLLQILVCTIIIAGFLATYGKLQLLTGVFTGYLLACDLRMGHGLSYMASISSKCGKS